MSIWEQVLLGMFAVVLVLFALPGVKVAMTKPRDPENADWGGLFLAIGSVVIFVVLLVVIARS